jgi:DNA-binding transcriptional LysR family regulator
VVKKSRAGDFMGNTGLNWTLDHLRMIRILDETGSLSETAQQMAITQPAVTQKLKQLEEGVGAPLWMRRGRQAGQLTATGQAFLAYSKHVLEETDRFFVTSGVAVRKVEVRVSASTIPGEHILPAVLAQFATMMPHLKVRITVTDSRGVIRSVESGETEVGFCGYRPRRSGLSSFPFFRDRIVFAVSPDHPFAGRSVPLSIAELSNQQIIRRESGSGTRRAVERMMLKRGLAFPKETIFLELGSTHSVHEAIGKNLGVGFISDEATGHLVTVPIDEFPPITRHFHVIYRKDRVEKGPVSEFIDSIHSYFNTG